MVQEVQQQGNRYQTPDRIIGIGYSERKMNDSTQIRDKKTNMVVFKGSAPFGEPGYTGEQFARNRTYTTTDGKTYKIDGQNIYMPLAGAYWVEYIAYTGFTQTHNCRIKVYVDGKVVFNDTQKLNDHINWRFTLNIGRKNIVKLSAEVGTTGLGSLPITLKFIKL